MNDKQNSVSSQTNPYHQFLRLVYKLRKAQKEYFKYRSKAMLTTAQQLEREVDKWLEQCGLEAAKIRQLSILPEDAQKEA